MEKLRNDLVTPEPAEITKKENNIDYGKIQYITYHSKKAKRDKHANVVLPSGYGNGEKFPVLYLNHGLHGNEFRMLEDEFALQTILGNLISKNLAEKMIVVATNMWSDTKENLPENLYTDEADKGYDAFLEDITDSLIPYIEKNFDVKTGRENTAITGFSMGGRESLYIGISRPDIFGYIGAACPAPGVVPTTDQFMIHKGSLTEEEFKIKDLKNYPYILFITGGDKDTIVVDYPEQYSKLLKKNGCDNVFQIVPGGTHSGNSVRSHFYNYLRYVFKGGK